jgi:hypothetical protein
MEKEDVALETEVRDRSVPGFHDKEECSDANAPITRRVRWWSSPALTSSAPRPAISRSTSAQQFPLQSR